MTWINYVSRDMSLTAIYYPYLAQTKRIMFDYEARNTFYFSKGTYLKGYKLDDEINQLLEIIKGLIKEGKTEEILEKFISIIQERDERNAKFLQTDLKGLSSEELISNLNDFHEFYKNYWSYHIFGFHLGHAVEGTEYEKILEEYKDLITKVRHAHPFKFYDEEYLPHLFDFMETKFEVTRGQLFFMTPPELISIIEGHEVDLEEVNKRTKYYLLTTVEGKETIYSGEEALIEYNKRIGEEDLADIKEVKGQVAYKGKVTGKVKIVLLKKDRENFPEGSILITSQTVPDFIPIIKQCKAIVTDEGGITCHAAIISREMKKPCIIGTKIATKVFKDGDLVEVDAEKGIVCKIK